MNIIQKEVKDLLREVCREEDLPFDVVKDIYLSQFRYVRDEIVKGEKGKTETYKNILLKYLGTFCISPGRMDWGNRLREIKLRENAKLNTEL